jgi:hypothetical protein
MEVDKKKDDVVVVQIHGSMKERKRKSNRASHFMRLD